MSHVTIIPKHMYKGRVTATTTTTNNTYNNNKHPSLAGRHYVVVVVRRQLTWWWIYTITIKNYPRIPESSFGITMGLSHLESGLSHLESESVIFFLLMNRNRIFWIGPNFRRIRIGPTKISFFPSESWILKMNPVLFLENQESENWDSDSGFWPPKILLTDTT